MPRSESGLQILHACIPPSVSALRASSRLSGFWWRAASRQSPMWTLSATGHAPSRRTDRTQPGPSGRCRTGRSAASRISISAIRAGQRGRASAPVSVVVAGPAAARISRSPRGESVLGLLECGGLGPVGLAEGILWGAGCSARRCRSHQCSSTAAPARLLSATGVVPSSDRANHEWGRVAGIVVRNRRPAIWPVSSFKEAGTRPLAVPSVIPSAAQGFLLRDYALYIKDYEWNWPSTRTTPCV